MGAYRFLRSRRWLVFAVVVAALAYGAWWLGEWQFDRLSEKKADNAVIRANESREPAPVGDVLTPGRGLDDADEWRRVNATGVYDTEHTIVVRYRNNADGAAGIDVVVPLVTDDGTALVVDRGFLETEDRSGSDVDLPTPPSGEVTVTGWARVDGTGDSTEVDGLSTRAISSQRIGEAIGRPVYGGFVDLESEDPAPASSEPALQQRQLPELDNGPHFFYGLQWWFFGVLALFGFGYLAYDERKRGPRGERPRRERDPRRSNVPAGSQRGQSARSMPPSTGSIAPEMNEAAGESRKAAARPNSSGSP